MNDRQYVFLGGIFSELQLTFIVENSRGVIQNAADAFQKKIISGLDAVLKEGVLVLNFPFVGSYPRFFRLPFFSKCDGRFGVKSRFIGYGFLNVFALRILSRFFSSFKALLSLPKSKDVVLFVYSAHLPFVLSAVLYKFFRRSTLICLILPDLPEYMGDNGRLRKFLKWFDVKFFYFLSRYFDRFVFLTEYMADRLDIPKSRYVVVEGIANHGSIQHTIRSAEKKSFLYTGTLAKRYGVMNLVAAFSKVENDSVELWICGDGDAKEEIVSAAGSDSRIVYYGQVDRSFALSLQEKASFLVNPRAPEGEYTKYSFPSKILEYMSSGKPVIMYKLDGVPEEYDQFYIAPNALGVDSLCECMTDVLKMSDEKLFKIGDSAKKFVFANKNPEVQAKKIINLFSQEI